MFDVHGDGSALHRLPPDGEATTARARTDARFRVDLEATA